MPDNSNPEAVRFSNEKVRVLADTLLSAYYTAKAVYNEWIGNNMGAMFPLGDTVVDGSAGDGRHPVTGNDVTNIIVRAEELKNDFEANGNAKLNTLVNVAVNGQSKV